MRKHFSLLLTFLTGPLLSLTAQHLTGKYSTVQNGVEYVVELKQNENQVTGQVSFGGEKGALKGAVTQGIASGNITDATTKQIFPFEAALENGMLTFIMYIKQDNSDVNIPLTFLMESNNNVNTPRPAEQPLMRNLDPTKAPKKPRDSKLIGIWRTTETINSGSGEFYMGMSTDYFMQFTQEGIAGVWQGKSAGGGAGSSFSSEGDSQITQLYWYSEPSYFILVDPQTKEEMKTRYQFHEEQLVLTGANGKYVFWTKVQ